MKVYGYARVSTTEQSEDFDALKQQVARLEKAGAEIVLIDVESGRSNSRKQFNELLKLVNRGLVREVVITRIDRLGRSALTLAKTIETFKNKNVKLRILDAPIDETSAIGKYSLHQMAGLAELESEILSERIRHGQSYFREQGKIYRAPFGYKLIDKKLVIDSETQPIARTIIEMMINNHGIKSISKYLWDNYQIKFAVSSIRHWINNPLIQGHTAYLRDKSKYKNRKPVLKENTHEALLSEQEFKIIKNNLLKKTKAGDTSRKNYPLKGLLKCSACQGRMHRIITKRSTGTQYITCNRAIQGLQFCTNNKCSRFSDIIKQVIDSIAQESTRITAIAETERHPQQDAESPAIKELKRQLTELKAIKANNPVIFAAIQKLETQIIIEENNLINDPEIIYSDERKKALWSLSQAAFWDEVPTDKLQLVLEDFIESVFIDASGTISVKFLS